MKELRDSVKIVNNVTGLKNAEQDIDCEKIKSLHGKDLEFELLKLGDKKITALLKVPHDSSALEIIKTSVCP
jgi:hypothetical protein